MDVFDANFMTGLAAGLGIAATLLIVFGVGFAVVRPWVRLKMSGGRGSLLYIMAMRLRGTPPLLIVDAYTSLLHAGEESHLMEIESQYVAHRAEISDVRDLMHHVREFKRRQRLAREKAEQH